mmetsp:Transcript_15980/g.36729  ORF Transcript_15980/g.36729 Transcript_15980/m.36729 type:complete len:81 (+) Transcript_15980:328-570(+)
MRARTHTTREKKMLFFFAFQNKIGNRGGKNTGKPSSMMASFFPLHLQFCLEKQKKQIQKTTRKRRASPRSLFLVVLSSST